MHARLLLLLALIAAASAFVALSAVFGGAVTESATHESGLRRRSSHPLKDPKLSSDLVALADATSTALPKSVAAARSAGELHELRDHDGRALNLGEEGLHDDATHAEDLAQRIRDQRRPERSTDYDQL